MERADRLLVLVAELRAAAPEPLGPRELAERLGVGERTVRRDLELLAAGGAPVRALPGGGHVLEEPPWAVVGEAESLTGPVRDTLAEAVRSRRAVRLAYTDRSGTRTLRDVEAQGLVTAPYGEYLVGWCRTREGPRRFRVDRIGAAYLAGRGVEVRELDELVAALRVPLPRPPSAPERRRGQGGARRGGDGPGAARAWTLERAEGVRERLREAAAEVLDGGEGAAALRAVAGHLAEWARWQAAAVRAAATGEEPVLEGRRPPFPRGFGRATTYAARERMIQDAMAPRSLGDVLGDLRQVLEGMAHWAAACDEALWEGALPDPRPYGPPGEPRPLADLLAGPGGLLAHVEWHLDRLPGDARAGAVERCPLRP
ncbi:helix-turn-helix transcriptional regulator [Actinomadura sp. LOL_016]|uniref:helix-turn-helix transcriptional regulator n=1 Tax=unclassified Actinomadura TaxID=2626254 RepID=UPI003A80BC3C